MSGSVILAAAWVLPGCAAQSPTAPAAMQSKVAVERVRAIVRAAAAGDESQLPHLVDRLDDEDAAVRFAAIMALERLAGTRLAYNYGDPPQARAAAVQRWRRYLTKRLEDPPRPSGGN